MDGGGEEWYVALLCANFHVPLHYDDCNMGRRRRRRRRTMLHYDATVRLPSFVVNDGNGREDGRSVVART